MDKELPETEEQRLWLEVNREWLIAHNAYPQMPITKKEADIRLYFLFHMCTHIKRPSRLVRAAIKMGAQIIREPD